MAPVRYLETGVLHCGDNARLLAGFPSECVDLIYLDPPFFSNKSYEVIWGDEAEVRSFEDRWAGGIRHYVEWMEPRLRHIQRILKPTGSVYLHCDPSASHYLKVVMDDIFEARHFRNEIIWRRYGAHNDVGQGSSHYGRVHDSILFYVKSQEAWWDQQFTPLSEEYIESTYRYVDSETGRRFTTKPLTAPGGAAKGNPQYEWNGHTRFWRYSQETMQALHDEGRLYYSRTGYVRQKHYLSESKGVPVQDLWTDVPALVGANDERLGYPTQKPEALMDRVIKSSCPRGGIVLDPFCGCGTTIAVAHRLKREWIGIDISPTAVNLMKRRMSKLGAAAKAEGLPTTVDDLKALRPFEFQNWVIQRVLGTHSPRKSGDMGIDGYSFFEQLPIQVKQSERVGRNVVDNFETAVERSGKHMGYVVAFSFTKGAHEEAARAKGQGKVAIVLVRVEDLIRVGELIQAADDHDQVPDLTRETPDLMRLFSAARERRPDRALPIAPRRDARPADKELIASARDAVEA